jgi:hypothetical protein
MHEHGRAWVAPAATATPAAWRRRWRRGRRRIRRGRPGRRHFHVDVLRIRARAFEERPVRIRRALSADTRDPPRNSATLPCTAP